MKYRHSFHAGNFADVHKHMTLLAVLAGLQRKDKGFLYLETHAGRGAYDLSESPGSRASRTGLARILGEPGDAPEIQAYGHAVSRFRDQAIAAHVELQKGERSELAELAANIL